MASTAQVHVYVTSQTQFSVTKRMEPVNACQVGRATIVTRTCKNVSSHHLFVGPLNTVKRHQGHTGVRVSRGIWEMRAVSVKVNLH